MGRRGDRLERRVFLVSWGRVSQVPYSEDLCAFFLGQTAPDSVWFAGSQGVPAAVLENRAVMADCLCLVDPSLFLAFSFARGVEEYLHIHTPTCGVQLPVPLFGDWEQGCGFHQSVIPTESTRRSCEAGSKPRS